MKKGLSLLLAGTLLLACNTPKSDLENASAITNSAIKEAHAETSAKLSLDGDAKWNADISTHLNVAILENIVIDARKHNAENYAEAATQLREALNVMLQECKMKSGDHDALHQWLEPIMADAGKLGNANNSAEAKEILAQMEQQLGLFMQYFS